MFSFEDAIRSAQAAVQAAQTPSEKQLAYAVGQLASALTEALERLEGKIDQLPHSAP
jgi:hypothetical protein